MKARKASEIKLSSEERATLERYVRRRKTGRSMAQRAEIILRAAAGENNCEIARAVQATRQTVRVWRERFSERRLHGLDDEPRCGAPRKIGDDRIEAIITKTLEQKPANS
jgi:transposase